MWMEYNGGSELGSGLENIDVWDETASQSALLMITSLSAVFCGKVEGPMNVSIIVGKIYPAAEGNQ